MMSNKIGLIIIGDEILSGKRQDKHMTHVLETIAPIGRQLAWVKYLGDDEKQLTANFQQTLKGREAVFCFGGIGATPDDRTRQSIAKAANVPLLRHPEAVKEIETQFGEGAYPKRVLMAEFPQGSELIPNPVNRVAGFSFRNHYFFPGFPHMAWPMLGWVLNQYFTQLVEQEVEKSIIIKQTPESELIDLMLEIEAAYPQVKVFSLPHVGSERYVELGIKGKESVDEAMAEIKAYLDGKNITYEN